MIFRSDSARAGKLRQTLESAMEADFGFEVKVVLRDADAMKALLNELPDTWANDEFAKCDVIFLGDDVDAPEVLERLVIKADIDGVRYTFRERYSGAWSVRRSPVVA